MYGVGPKDSGFRPIEMLSEFLAFRKKASSSKTSEAFGDLLAVDFDGELSVGGGNAADASIAETVDRDFIAM